MKSLLSVFICFVIIITFTSNAYCESKFKCGKEYRFITNDGIEYQGHLLKNDSDSLTLRKGTTIALSNVESAYRVKRHTVFGAVFGFAIGTGVGIFVAKKWDEKQTHEPFEFHIGEITSIIIGGAVIGCLTGGIIGHHTPSHYKFKLEMLTLCSSPYGDIMPVKLNLTYNF
ncbi:MAG: hypothetical protein IH914_07485 [candidate division Zixibacteria bacterium]|nr:hypothetical protein [candidate division Zixibacteria bacterium]